MGTQINTVLSFQILSDSIYNKELQCLYLLRELRNYNVSLIMAYWSLLESILPFNITSWHNCLTSKEKTKLFRIIDQAGKITGSPQTPLLYLCELSVIRISSLITEDLSHPLHHSFSEEIPSPTGQKHSL